MYILKIIYKSQLHFKVGLSPSKKKKCFICFNESPSKVMKNAFHYVLKALFVCLFVCFFLSELSFTDIYDSQDSRGRGRLSV